MVLSWGGHHSTFHRCRDSDYRPFPQDLPLLMTMPSGETNLPSGSDSGVPAR